MNSKKLNRISAFLILILSITPIFSQHLHTNDEYDECSLILSPNLTQKAFAQFNEEAGIVTYFRPLNSAKPLGVNNYEFSILNWGTRIDDKDDAWNDTFSHPDSAHYLFEGNALQFPGLMFRIGLTERIDAGVYFTKNPGANYGFVGAQIQYNNLNDVNSDWAIATRLGFNTLYGPEDVNLSVYGLDVLASKEIYKFTENISFTTYAGLSGFLATSEETTSKVNLKDEAAFGVQSNLGFIFDISYVRLGYEINFAKVSGYSFKIGVLL